MSASVSLDTYGLQQALKNLQKIDPALRRAVLKDIKKAAEPLTTTINNRVPGAPPLSGMNNKGRTGWDKVKKVVVSLNTKKPRRQLDRPGYDQIAVVRVITKGAPVAIADMAGKAGGTKSRAPVGRRRPNFASALGSRLGDASRFMWRDVDALQAEAERALKPIIDKVMADAQKDLS